jgi:hypothetical protein
MPRAVPPETSRLLVGDAYSPHDRTARGGGTPPGAAVVEARVLHGGATAGASAALVVFEVLDRRAAMRAENVEDVVRGPASAVLARAPSDVHDAPSTDIGLRRPSPDSSPRLQVVDSAIPRAATRKPAVAQSTGTARGSARVGHLLDPGVIAVPPMPGSCCGAQEPGTRQRSEPCLTAGQRTAAQTLTDDPVCPYNSP